MLFLFCHDDKKNLELTKHHAPKLIQRNVLDYFLKITGYSREEFYQIMSERKLGQLKDVNVPVQEYDRERYREILPFVVDFIREIINEYPTGDTRDSAEDTR